MNSSRRNTASAKGKKMKNATNLYEVRYWPTPYAYSKQVGFKGKLVTFRQAQKIVKRLKKSGIDAFHAKLSVKI